MYEILVKFKFGSGASHCIMYVIINVAHAYLSGSILSSRFWDLNRAVSSQIYKKYNLQRASAELVSSPGSANETSAELAMCTACVDECWVGPRVLLHALRHYTLRVKIISVDFNLAVSTWTTKLSNLIPCQIFYGYTVYAHLGIVYM